MRCSSSPSLTIFTRSVRSAALRKLRFVFTRRLESIPLIRSNDFRKSEESRYIFVIVHLFLPRRFFGDRLVPGGQESFLSCEDTVEHVDDFTVRHSRDVRSDSETRPRNAGVSIVDNRVVSLARYPHLIDYGAGRLIQAHFANSSTPRI